MADFSSRFANSVTELMLLAEGEDTRIAEKLSDTIQSLQRFKSDVSAEFKQTQAQLDELQATTATVRLNDYKSILDEQFGNTEAMLNDLYSQVKSNSPNRVEKESIISQLSALREMIDPDAPQPVLATLPHNVAEVNPPTELPAFTLSSESGNGFKYNPQNGLSANLAQNDLAETAETAFAPSIMQLAESLGGAVEIYEYVKNNVNFEPYYGSRKGAEATLNQMAGNAFDQASLLIALLRCIMKKSILTLSSGRYSTA
jgi:hypothetical protein